MYQSDWKKYNCETENRTEKRCTAKLNKDDCIVNRMIQKRRAGEKSGRSKVDVAGVYGRHEVIRQSTNANDEFITVPFGFN